MLTSAAASTAVSAAAASLAAELIDSRNMDSFSRGVRRPNTGNHHFHLLQENEKTDNDCKKRINLPSILRKTLFSALIARSSPGRSFLPGDSVCMSVRTVLAEVSRAAFSAATAALAAAAAEMTSMMLVEGISFGQLYLTIHNKNYGSIRR